MDGRGVFLFLTKGTRLESRWIVISYTDESTFTEKTDTFRIHSSNIQHETDHLEGILYTTGQILANRLSQNKTCPKQEIIMNKTLLPILILILGISACKPDPILTISKSSVNSSAKLTRQPLQ